MNTNEIVIGDHNYQQFISPQLVGGEHKGFGLIPRNYSTHPIGFYQNERAMVVPTFTIEEIRMRLKDKVAQKALLSDIRNRGMFGQRIPSRDQDGKGYCWAHSGTSANLVKRAAMNLPYVDLSAFMIACIIKNYRDEGGWGAEGLDFQLQHGVPSSKYWPQQSMSRSNDTPEMRANAKLHAPTDYYIDTANPQYDRKFTFLQELTLLLLNDPVIKDENWWGHSICGLDPVDGVEQRSYCRVDSGKLATLEEFEFMWGFNTDAQGMGVRIWNSWGDDWSEGGTGVLTGNKAISDGATAIKVITASIA